MRDRKIGVAVIGLGVGAQHALAYGSTGLCQLRWVHDLDVEKARKMAITLEADGVAESYEQVLDDPDVQAVSIASYDDVHFDQVVAALNAGKHVFVEKPLCETVDELETVKRAWWKHEGALKLSSNLILRDAPIYRWLKQKIRMETSASSTRLTVNTSMEGCRKSPADGARTSRATRSSWEAQFTWWISCYG